MFTLSGYFITTFIIIIIIITRDVIARQHIMGRWQEFHLLPLGTISRGNKPHKIGDLLPITYLRKSAHKTYIPDLRFFQHKHQITDILVMLCQGEV